MVYTEENDLYNIVLPQLFRRLDDKKECCIYCHIRPDGDTICSALAFAYALQKMGYKCDIRSSDKLPDIYKIYTDTFIPDTVSEPINIAVDVSTQERLGSYSDKKMDFVFDHHFPNTVCSEFIYTAPEYSSCGELIYEIIAKYLKDVSMSDCRNIREMIAAALITDTDCMKSTSVNTHTFKTLYELSAMDTDINKVISYHYLSKSSGKLAFESIFASGISYYSSGRIACGTVFLSDVAKSGIDISELEDISEFISQIKNVMIAVTVRERYDGTTRISIRTKGDYDASEICSYYNGGGHKYSAGCLVDMSPDKAQAEIIKRCCEYISQFDNNNKG